MAYDGATSGQSQDRQSSSRPVPGAGRRPAAGCGVAAAWPPEDCAG